MFNAAMLAPMLKMFGLTPESVQHSISTIMADVAEYKRQAACNAEVSRRIAKHLNIDISDIEDHEHGNQ